MSVTVLEQEMYSEAEGARLLGVPQSSLHYWLEGKEQDGRSYAPVIRSEPRGRGASVTWGEFVEAGWLRSYRQQSVPLREMRLFIEHMRGALGVPHPLASRRPLVVGRHLVLAAQEEAGLAPNWWLVTEVGGQLSLLPPGDDFLRRVVWNGDDPSGYRVDGIESPVTVSPDLRFGKPAVGGVSTEVLWEHQDAGEGEEEILADFGVSRAEYYSALAYESRKWQLVSRAA